MRVNCLELRIGRLDIAFLNSGIPLVLESGLRAKVRITCSESPPTSSFALQSHTSCALAGECPFVDVHDRETGIKQPHLSSAVWWSLKAKE